MDFVATSAIASVRLSSSARCGSLSHNGSSCVWLSVVSKEDPLRTATVFFQHGFRRGRFHTTRWRTTQTSLTTRTQKMAWNFWTNAPRQKEERDREDMGRSRAVNPPATVRHLNRAVKTGQCCQGVADRGQPANSIISNTMSWTQLHTFFNCPLLPRTHNE